MGKDVTVRSTPCWCGGREYGNRPVNHVVVQGRIGGRVAMEVSHGEKSNEERTRRGNGAFPVLARDDEREGTKRSSTGGVLPAERAERSGVCVVASPVQE